MTTATARSRERTTRPTRRAVGFAAALCLGTAATGSAHAQATPAAERSSAAPVAADAFDRAHDAYDEGRWEAAYRTFAALADGGDAEAARIAWLMHRHGPALYRTALPASDTQRVRWQQISAAAVPLPFRSTSTLAWQRAADADPSHLTANAGATHPRR